MQTLNVGAGRSDEEYKAAEEQRLHELKNDVKTYARFFFIAAACACLGGGLFLVKLNLAVNIGAIDLFLLYGRELLRTNPILLPMVTAMLGTGAGWPGICRRQRTALGLLGRHCSLCSGCGSFDASF